MRTDNKKYTLLETLYINGQFDNLKKQLVEKKNDYSLGQFHFNLGTVYLKEGNLSAARYNLEKSLSEDYINVRSITNLHTTKKELSKKSFEHSGFNEYVDTMLLVPTNLYLMISLILIVFSTLLFKMKIVKRKLVWVVFMIISLTPLFFSSFFLSKLEKGIVLNNGNVREGPHIIYPAIKNVTEGNKLILGEYRDGFFFIRYPREISGWIKSEKIGLL
jgi:hypothetical protein